MSLKAKKSRSGSRKLPIPITLLSGFLGSGKTTLLENILTTNHGLKVAVIINDVSQLNIDAALIQDHKVTKKEEKLIQLQNGCICCTLRGDLLEELVSLAKLGQFQYIVIESTGISEPMQVAETFSSEFTEMLLQGQDTITKEEEKVLHEILELGGLNKLTKLDTCVTVVDSVNFLSNVETTDFLVDRYGDNNQGERERTITDLMVDQIEFADVIIMNKVSSISKKYRKKIHKIIKSLNPIAKIINTDYCKVDIDEVINTKRFDFEKASTSAGWLQSINEMTLREGFGTNGQATLTPKPETEEYGINNFVYKSRKPFHPERLYSLLYDKFVILEQPAVEETEETYSDNEENETSASEEEDQEDEESEDEQDLQFPEVSSKKKLKNKKKSAFGPMLRSKGFFWLASRHIIRGEWSSAGSMLTLKGGIPWFAVSGPSFFPPEARKLIEKDMQGKFGDRRNELVFIGVNINKRALTEALDSCLLTDTEYLQFEELVSTGKNLFYIEKALQGHFNDGFESWINFDEDEDETTREKNINDPEETPREEKKGKKSKGEVGSTEKTVKIESSRHGHHSHVRVNVVKS